MPNYDFRCLTCNIIVEMKERTLPPCPQCSEVMNRVWDAPAIRFKGSGFYSTGG